MTYKNNTLELKIQPRVVLRAPRPNDVEVWEQKSLKKIRSLSPSAAIFLLRGGKRREVGARKVENPETSAPKQGFGLSKISLR